MVMMGADAAFVDTNLLVYASRRTSLHHRNAIAALQQLQYEAAEAWISRQVIREYLAVVTRPQHGVSAIPVALAADDIRRFALDFQVAEDGPAITEHLLELIHRFPTGGRQVHDANIVATMLTYGIRRLLTFNADDFLRFAEIIDIQPVTSTNGQ